MHEDGENFEENEFRALIEKFEKMINDGSFVFFDADDFEEIIEHYFQTQNADLLQKALDAASTQYPDNTSFKISNAQYLASQQQTTEALKILNDLEPDNSENADIFLTRGYIYSQMGLSEQSIENFKTALKYSDAPDEVCAALGSEFINKSEYDNAIFYLKKGFQFNPQNEMIVGELAISYELSGKKEEALQFFTKFTDEYPYNKWAWFNLGIAYNRLGMYEKALEAYDYAITIDPEFSSAYFNKGNSFAMLGQYLEAVGVYKETFNYEEPDPAAYYYIGECYENLADYTNALAYYNRAVKLDPKMADAWISIGIIG
jgi:tetratricopeptide (TPR) repeat protein